MFKYLYNYIVLLLIFLLTDIFLLIVPSFYNVLGYIPTITTVGRVTIFLLIPYTYLIVRLLFIKKANVKGNTVEYLNIKKKLLIIVTTINVIVTFIQLFFLQNTTIWICYTVFMLFFLMVLKTKKESLNNITEKNIKKYFDKK